MSHKTKSICFWFIWLKAVISKVSFVLMMSASLTFDMIIILSFRIVFRVL